MPTSDKFFIAHALVISGCVLITFGIFFGLCSPTIGYLITATMLAAVGCVVAVAGCIVQGSAIRELNRRMTIDGNLKGGHKDSELHP